MFFKVKSFFDFRKRQHCDRKETPDHTTLNGTEIDLNTSKHLMYSDASQTFRTQKNPSHWKFNRIQLFHLHNFAWINFHLKKPRMKKKSPFEQCTTAFGSVWIGKTLIYITSLVKEWNICRLSFPIVAAWRFLYDHVEHPLKDSSGVHFLFTQQKGQQLKSWVATQMANASIVE